jgi:hypothetical protein
MGICCYLLDPQSNSRDFFHGSITSGLPVSTLDRRQTRKWRSSLKLHIGPSTKQAGTHYGCSAASRAPRLLSITLYLSV